MNINESKIRRNYFSEERKKTIRGGLFRQNNPMIKANLKLRGRVHITISVRPQAMYVGKQEYTPTVTEKPVCPDGEKMMLMIY